MSKYKLTYGSLFSGVGGFDMGFDQAGYDCVFQVEWDKNCQKVLAKHWPDVPKWADVCDVNGAEVPPCDVLIFGSPCQDLSVAGKRAGLEGEKSSMFFEAIRIIKEMRDATQSIYPRVVVWENVPGALSSNNGADFGEVLDTLADIGAVDIQWAVLDAQHFGVPQRRRRVFVVAVYDAAVAERCPETLLPVVKGSRGDFAKGRKARQGVARNVEASIDTSNEQMTEVFGEGSFAQFVEGQVSSLKYAGGGLGGGSENLVVPFVKSRRAQNDTDDETWIPGDVSPTLNAFDNGGESRATVLMPVAYSIREDAKANNFSATETDVALTLGALVPSTQSHHAQIFIAEPQPPFVFDGTRHDDFRMDSETVPTLKQRMGTGGGQVPMIAEPVVYDGYNQSLDDSGIHRSLRIGRDSSDFVAQPTYSFDTQFGSNAAVFEDQSPTLKSTQQSPSVTMPGLAVRRLTPLECERLMGWPDDHTRWTADGKEQADTNRYKQCGNGVATPVARWVAGHIANILTTEVK